MYNKDTPNIMNELFMVVAYILCIYGVFFSFGNLININFNIPISDILNQITLNLIVIGSVLYFEITKNNNTFLSFIGFRKSNLKLYFIYSVLGFLVAVLFSSVLNFFSKMILPQIPAFFDGIDTLSVNKIFFLSLFIAPFSEEIFFRGFLQNILIQKYGAKLGILFTVLTFGLLHVVYLPYSAAFLSILFLGLILSVVKYQTHSLIPCIVIHLLNNMLAYSVLFN